MLHIHKGRRRKHNTLVEQQARLAVDAIPAIDNAQEVVQVDQRHVRIDVLDIALQQRILQRNVGQRQGALECEILHILGGDLGRQRPHKRGKLGSGIGEFERVEELRRAAVSIGGSLDSFVSSGLGGGVDQTKGRTWLTMLSWRYPDR